MVEVISFWRVDKGKQRREQTYHNPSRIRVLKNIIRHSPDDRRLKPTLRRLGVPGNLGPPPPTSSRQVLEHADKERRTENASSVVNIRTSPVVFDRKRDNRTLYAVDVTGGDRSSATSRRMSANRFRGMATSAIWKAT